MFTIIGADGKEYGPVDSDTIKAWIAAGRANHQTKARGANETEWKTLGDFAEFNQPPVLVAPPAPVAVPPAPAAFAPANNNRLEPAGRGLRLGAQLLDGLIAGVCVAPGIVLLASAGVFSSRHPAGTAMVVGGIALTGAAFLILLAVQIYLLTTRGQTIGKKLVGVKIVNFDDETNAGFVKAVLLRVFVNGAIGAVPILGPCYSLTDILFIFGDNRRCLHDLIAGTKVVKA